MMNITVTKRNSAQPDAKCKTDENVQKNENRQEYDGVTGINRKQDHRDNGNNERHRKVNSG